MNTAWYLDVNHFARHTPALHGALAAYATYGVGVFGLLVLAGWWLARSQADPPRAVAAAIWAAAGTIVAVAANQLIVHAVHEPRPYATHPGVEVLVARSHDFSFPSDHAITAGAATAGLWLIARYGSRAATALATVGTALALLLAFARVYVGAHYPADVAAALAIGAAITLAGWLLLGWLATATLAHLAALPVLRPLIIAQRPAHAAHSTSAEPALPRVLGGRQERS